MSASPMPDWAPKIGPWCLKQWLPTGRDQHMRFGTVVRTISEDTKVDTCLLEWHHDGDCRGIHGDWLNHEVAMFLGDREGGHG